MAPPRARARRRQFTLFSIHSRHCVDLAAVFTKRRSLISRPIHFLVNIWRDRQEFSVSQMCNSWLGACPVRPVPSRAVPHFWTLSLTSCTVVSSVASERQPVGFHKPARHKTVHHGTVRPVSFDGRDEWPVDVSLPHAPMPRRRFRHLQWTVVAFAYDAREFFWCLSLQHWCNLPQNSKSAGACSIKRP